jgi:PhnB protein
MMHVNAYLTFRGECAEAFKFYEQSLGGKIQSSMTFAETPMKENLPPEWHGKVIHAALKIGDTLVFGSDAPPNYFRQPQGFSVALALNDPAEAERIFKALSEGGRIEMPLQKTFWARLFGSTVDRFGIPWMVNCE